METKSLKIVENILLKYLLLSLSVCCVLGLCCAPLNAQSTALEPDFTTAAPHWRPGKHTPLAIPDKSARALLLPCPLQQGVDRVYWDRQVSFDLRQYPVVQLELEVDNPAAVRQIGFYLKSGAGWYVWLTPVPGSGRRQLAFNQQDAGIEGRPAGRHNIDGIRVSAVPGIPADTTLKLYSLTASRPSVALVRGTTSTPNTSERNAAASATRRIAHWLDQLGVLYNKLADEDVAAGKLVGARVAILPYNPYPPPAELKALTRYVQSGGKLIVFYGAEPALAQLMGLRLGAYQRAETIGQWSAMSFNRHAPQHAPRIVRQDSNNIRLIMPEASHSDIIAYWCNAAGQRDAAPAWVRSEAGLWMSHILLGGDDEKKQTLLLALLAAYDPSIWQSAARHALARAGHIGPLHGFEQAFDAIQTTSQAHSRQDVTRPFLRQSRQSQNAWARQAAADNWQAAFTSARQARQALMQAYAAAQAPTRGELRGVWNHDGLGLYPGDWDRTARQLRDAGITTVFPNLAWAGVSHYPSRVTPLSLVARTYGDQLRAAAAATRRYGLTLHLWKVCWNLGPASSEHIEQLRRAGRLQVTASGESLPWLCPSHPKNLQQELQAIKEVAATGLIDGLHLDYIRYPGAHACFCNWCRQRFESSLGRKVTDWPESARSGALAQKYQDWRCRQITALVLQTKRALKEINPQIKLSAAVYQSYPDCRRSIAQDWGAWLRDGLLDFVVPMNYTENTAMYSETLARQQALPGAAGRILPGIGVTAAESQLTPDRVIEQILQTRAQRCNGFVLFDLTPTLAEETLPIIKLLPAAPNRPGEPQVGNRKIHQELKW